MAEQRRAGRVDSQSQNQKERAKPATVNIKRKGGFTKKSTVVPGDPIPPASDEAKIEELRQLIAQLPKNGNQRVYR